MSQSNNEYPLFETLLIIDGEIQNLAYHQRRFFDACQNYFGRAPDFFLLEAIVIPEQFALGRIRCRIDYNPHSYQTRFFNHQPKKLETFALAYAENLDYRFKYADRTVLDRLKNPETDEIIIINNGFVSDCAIGNLLFSKQGKWYSSSHYLLKGTQLSRLVDEGIVELIEIHTDNLADFEQVMMVNALNPFDLSRAVPIKSGIIR